MPTCPPNLPQNQGFHWGPSYSKGSCLRSPYFNSCNENIYMSLTSVFCTLMLFKFAGLLLGPGTMVVFPTLRPDFAD